MRDKIRFYLANNWCALNDKIRLLNMQKLKI